MKQTATKEIAARIDEIKSRIKATMHSNDPIEVIVEAHDELEKLLHEYNTCDIVFEENGKKGLKDIAGTVRVPAIYEGFTESYSYTFNRKKPVPARNETGKYALVATDGTGVPMCDFEYSYIEFMFASEDYYRCEKDVDGKTKSGVLNAQGELLVPCEMDVVHAISNSFSGIVKDGKVGFLTTSGMYIAPIFDDVEDEGEYLKACKDGVWGYIGTDGCFIPENDEVSMENAVLLSLYA